MTDEEVRKRVLDNIPCLDTWCDKEGITIDTDLDGEAVQAQCQYCHENRFPVADAIVNLVKETRLDELRNLLGGTAEEDRSEHVNWYVKQRIDELRGAV